MTDVDPVELAAREHWGRVLALLVGQFRRFDLAEDCLQDAFVAATRTWSERGVPSNPGAWLLTAARRRALDVLRSEATATRKAPLVIVDEQTHARAAADAEAPEIADERLRLIFTCCHPTIAGEASAALTLRLVAGLSVHEIARLFLVSEPTMSARLTRAKRKIVDAGVPFAVPLADRLAERLDAVLTVIYLIFTEGYRATSGPELVRIELAGEAIRLARTLSSLMGAQPVIDALLALMLLQHSRRDGRIGADGRLVLLPDQDRSAWHHDETSEALALLSGPGLQTGGDLDPVAQRYRLQALIAAAHATPATAAETDWPAIASYYADLEALTGSPVVRLNRAVAVAEAGDPAGGLALLDGLDTALPRNHLLPATRAELLARLGRTTDSIAAFDRALELVGTDAERVHLERRRRSVAARPRSW